MGRIFLLCILFFTSVPVLAQKNNSKAKETPKLLTLKDSATYAMGYNLALNVTKSFDSVDVDILAWALRDGFAKTKPYLNQDSFNIWTGKYLGEKNQRILANNMSEARQFLSANAHNPGVITTATGLQYVILAEGNGAKPTSANNVKVHYFGKLINGYEFDNSYKKGQPAVFGLNQVITGWTEILQLMQPGSKFRVFIPPALGYGERGMSRANIPGNSLLIFEMELLEVL